MLVSDGKPNLSFSGLDPVDEAFQTAASLRRNGITFIFIDTEPNPLAFGYGPDIARKAGGDLSHLDRSPQEQGLVDI